MTTNQIPTIGRVPVFKNILSLRSTPRIPVIPYFTPEQWKMATRGIKFQPMSKPDPEIPRLHYQPAPWGRGDVIVVFKEFVSDPAGALCTPRVKVKRDRNGGLQIEMVMDCLPPQVRYGCKAYYRLFPGRIDYSIDPVGCEDIGCKGHCTPVVEGAQTVGDIYCICNRVR